MTEDLKALDTGVSCHCDQNWMWRGVDQTTDGSGDVFQHVTDKQISSENRARGRPQHGNVGSPYIHVSWSISTNYNSTLSSNIGAIESKPSQSEFVDQQQW